MAGSRWLIRGGILSVLAAILHLAVIAGGPSWSRFVGAGEAMAQAAERGSATPALITLAIAAILTIWALYAFSGAGIVRRLPLLRTALVLISAVYLLRAFALVPALILKPEVVDTFAVVSSLIVLAYGLAYAIGTWAQWPALKVARADAQPG
jgi:hypothetical protein